MPIEISLSSDQVGPDAAGGNGRNAYSQLESHVRQMLRYIRGGAEAENYRDDTSRIDWRLTGFIRDANNPDDNGARRITIDAWPVKTSCPEEESHKDGEANVPPDKPDPYTREPKSDNASGT